MGKLKLKNFFGQSVLMAIMMVSLLSSCMKEMGDHHFSVKNATVTLQIDNVGEYSQTKSIYTPDENRINDLNLFVYSSDGNLYDSFYGQAVDYELSLAMGQTFSFYVLANYGAELTPSATEFALKNRVLDYSLSDLNDCGIPMAGQLEDVYVAGDTDLLILVQRLLAKVGVRIDESALETASYVYKSVSLKQCPTHIRPWTSSYYETQSVADGDMASEEELLTIKDNELFFYLPENCRGSLLTNSDPWQKVPDKLSCSELLPYVEIVASYENVGLSDENSKFRFYVGGNSTDNFDIKRNHLYHITLFPSDEGIFKGSWKMEAENMQSTRNLSFNRNKLYMQAEDSERIRVIVEPDAYEYDLIYDKELWEEYGISVSKTFNILTIQSAYKGLKDLALTLTVRDKSGFASADCDISVSANLEPFLESNFKHLDMWGGNEYALSFTYSDGAGNVKNVVPTLSELSFSSPVPSSLLSYSSGMFIAEDWWGKTGDWIGPGLTYTAVFTYSGVSTTISGSLNGHSGFGEIKATDYYYREFTKSDTPSLTSATLTGSTSTNVLNAVTSLSSINMSSVSNWKYDYLKVGVYQLDCSFVDPSNGKIRTCNVPMTVKTNVRSLEGTIVFKELYGGYNGGRELNSFFEVTTASPYYDSDINLTCDVLQEINFQIYGLNLKYIDHKGNLRYVDKYDDWTDADLFLGFDDLWIDWYTGNEEILFRMNGFDFGVGYCVN